MLLISWAREIFHLGISQIFSDLGSVGNVFCMTDKYISFGTGGVGSSDLVRLRDWDWRPRTPLWQEEEEETSQQHPCSCSRADEAPLLLSSDPRNPRPTNFVSLYLCILLSFCFSFLAKPPFNPCHYLFIFCCSFFSNHLCFLHFTFPKKKSFSAERCGCPQLRNLYFPLT